MSELNIDVYDVQHDFIACDHRFTGFIGGIGSGKSYAGAVKALLYMLENPSWKRGMVVAPTYQVLKDSTWETCLEVWAPFIADYVTTPAPKIVLVTGQEIWFRSGENPERLRGPNLWWAWIDEGAYCDPRVWPRMIGRLRAGGIAGPCFITTTPNQLNWVADLAKSGHISIFIAETERNPFVSQEFIDDLYKMYDGQLAAQELKGRFLKFGAGLIKTEWFTPLHYSRLPRDLKWYRYWDLATSTKKRADYTASVRIARYGLDCFYSRPFLFRAEWPDAKEFIQMVMQDEAGETLGVGVEANGFQLAASQELRRLPEAKMMPVFPVTTDRDKLSAAIPFIGNAKLGQAYYVQEQHDPRYHGKIVPWSEWNVQLAMFPEGEHDDAVDAMSGAYASEDQMPRRPKVRARGAGNRRAAA